MCSREFNGLQEELESIAVLHVVHEEQSFPGEHAQLQEDVDQQKLVAREDIHEVLGEPTVLWAFVQLQHDRRVQHHALQALELLIERRGHQEALADLGQARTDAIHVIHVAEAEHQVRFVHHKAQDVGEASGHVAALQVLRQFGRRRHEHVRLVTQARRLNCGVVARKALDAQIPPREVQQLLQLPPNLMTARGPARWPAAASSLCSTGKAYAAVLPLPVRARTSRSLPCNASGMHWLCTKVGRTKPRRITALSRRGSRPQSLVANVGDVSGPAFDILGRAAQSGGQVRLQRKLGEKRELPKVEG
eukprot:scaffold576_cov260-Pinguiococcus_pyrenoidosus.AAC.101